VASLPIVRWWLTLGILPDVMDHQNRNRMARLSAIAAHPDRLGIGIDEDVPVRWWRDGLGKGTVTIVDPVSHTNQPHVERLTR